MIYTGMYKPTKSAISKHACLPSWAPRIISAHFTQLLLSALSMYYNMKDFLKHFKTLEMKQEYAHNI